MKPVIEIEGWVTLDEQHMYQRLLAYRAADGAIKRELTLLCTVVQQQTGFYLHFSGEIGIPTLTSQIDVAKIFAMQKMRERKLINA